MYLHEREAFRKGKVERTNGKGGKEGKGRVRERKKKERGGRREVKKGGGVRYSLLCFLNVRD